MDWLAFTAEMTRALAWPLAVFGTALLLRHQLVSLLERLSTLKWRDWQADFERERAEVIEGIDRVDPRALAQIDDQNELLTLAKRQPRAAIVTMALMLESRIRELANNFEPDVKSRPPGQLIRLLQAKGVIDNQTANSLQGLFQMRNLAVHSREAEMTEEKAEDFIMLANAILFVLSTKGTGPDRS